MDNLLKSFFINLLILDQFQKRNELIMEELSNGLLLVFAEFECSLG